jgi:hypothetical protein
MNHQKIYDDIIENAKSKNRKKLRKNNPNYVYYEKHHIIPKCLNGNDEKHNLILLTGREHYICHKLLTYIYKDNRSIACAFFRMTFDKKGNRKISSRDYAYAKELYHNIPKQSSYDVWLEKYGKEEADKRYISCIEKMKNHIFSEEHRIKLSKFQKDKKRKPLSEEHKQKISKSETGQKRSEETKQKMRKPHGPMSEETKQKLRIINLGKKESEETKLKIGLKSKGRKHTEESKQKMRKPKTEEHKQHIKDNHYKTKNKLNKIIYE